MGIIDEMSKQLSPHTERIAGVLHNGLSRMEARISDLGKPDTGDQFFHISRKAKIPVGQQPLRVQIGGGGRSGPSPGEIWLLQCMCTNGATLKSPAWTLRTNTGRLIAAVIKEGIGMETPGGDIPILFGEELIFEPAEEGEFDFTITFKRRFYERPHPNAIGGVSGERHDRASHGVELSERQMQQIPEDAHSPWRAQGSPATFTATDQSYGGDIDPSAFIGGEPSDTEPET